MTDESPKVKIENSCGCVFCDLGDTPRAFQGKPAHIQRSGDVILAIRQMRLKNAQNKSAAKSRSKVARSIP